MISVRRIATSFLFLGLTLSVGCGTGTPSGMPPPSGTDGGANLSTVPDGVKSGNRLAVGYMVSTGEGSQMPFGFVDRQLGDLPCHPVWQNTGYRCVPDFAEPSSYYFDKDCKQPIFRSAACQPPRSYVGYSGECGAYILAATPVQPPGQAWNIGGGGCGTATLPGNLLTDRLYAASGDPLPNEMWAPLSFVRGAP